MIQQQITDKAKELINNNKLNEAENMLSSLEDKYSIFELAKIRKIQGRTREAEQLYLKSLSMTSEIKSNIDSDINVELGRIYSDYGNIEKAKKYYNNGLGSISLEKNIYKELGILYGRTGQYEKAKENLEKAIRLFPTDIRSNFALAIVYICLGKNELAKMIFNKLLSNKEIKADKFLYNKILNEYEILMKKEILESKPIEIRNALTTKCNAGCRYCSVWKDGGRWNQSEKITKEVVDLFPYLQKVHWLGGEVFLYNGFDDILEEGFKYDNLTQTILTNGLLLNEKILRKLAKGKEKRIKLIIAIDAGKKETYEYLRRGSSWDKLCANLELIKEINHEGNRIHTTFNAVISKSNYKEMFDMVEMAHKYDFDRVRFMNILGDGDENIFLRRDMQAVEYIGQINPLVEKKAKEYGLEYENHLVKKEEKYYYNDTGLKTISNNEFNLCKADFKCSYPWKRVLIDQRGPIRPCERCSDWLGDTNKQTIKEFWNSKPMQIYRKHFAEGYVCGGRGYNLQDNIYGGPNDISEWSNLPGVF
jgi:MoaA/NifB/PqqE/SkfB family radical SAM enzyme